MSVIFRAIDVTDGWQSRSPRAIDGNPVIAIGDCENKRPVQPVRDV